MPEADTELRRLALEWASKFPGSIDETIDRAKQYLGFLENGAAINSVVVEPVKLTPAVPIKKSVHPDFLICLDDGHKVKMLKRHLTSLGMTPETYRQKWGLPADYPMTAPNYAKARSDLAKQIGLGRSAHPRATAVAAETRRGRRRAEATA